VRILVTGSGGAIGRHLARQLEALGHAVVELSRSTGIDWHDADGLARALGPAVAGCDAVVHCAARVHRRGREAMNEAAFHAANVVLTRQLAEAAVAAGVRRFVHLSTIAVHGLAHADHLIGRSTPVAPRDPYGRSKWLGEQMLIKAAESAQHGMEVVILRPPVVYGADVAGNIARLARALAHRWPLPLGALTTNRRSLCAIDGLVEAIVWALADARAVDDAGLGIWYPCDPLPVSTRRLAVALARGLGVRARLPAWPPRLMMAIARPLAISRLVEQLAGDLEIDPRPLEQAGFKSRIDSETALEAVGAALARRLGKQGRWEPPASARP